MLLLSNVICLSTGNFANASSVGINIVIFLFGSSSFPETSGRIRPRELLMNLKLIATQF